MRPICTLFFVCALICAQPVQALKGQSAYRKAIKIHTRSHEAYQNDLFFVSTKWSATQVNAELTTLQNQRLDQIYQGVSVEQPRWLQLASEHKNWSVFVVNFYAYNHKSMDLHKKESGWILSLRRAEQVNTPVLIEKLKVTPLIQSLIPYSDIWSNLYVVAFPVSPSADMQTLSIRGPEGHDELTWP